MKSFPSSVTPHEFSESQSTISTCFVELIHSSLRERQQVAIDSGRLDEGAREERERAKVGEES